MLSTRQTELQPGALVCNVVIKGEEEAPEQSLRGSPSSGVVCPGPTRTQHTQALGPRHPRHPHLCFWGWSSRISQQLQPPSQPPSRRSSGQEATGQSRKGVELQLSMRSWLPTWVWKTVSRGPRTNIALSSPPLSGPVHSLT